MITFPQTPSVPTEHPWANKTCEAAQHPQAASCRAGAARGHGPWRRQRSGSAVLRCQKANEKAEPLGSDIAEDDRLCCLGHTASSTAAWLLDRVGGLGGVQIGSCARAGARPSRVSRPCKRHGLAEALSSWQAKHVRGRGFLRKRP